MPTLKSRRMPPMAPMASTVPTLRFHHLLPIAPMAPTVPTLRRRYLPRIAPTASAAPTLRSRHLPRIAPTASTAPTLRCHRMPPMAAYAQAPTPTTYDLYGYRAPYPYSVYDVRGQLRWLGSGSPRAQSTGARSLTGRRVGPGYVREERCASARRGRSAATKDAPLDCLDLPGLLRVNSPRSRPLRPTRAVFRIVGWRYIPQAKPINLQISTQRSTELKKKGVRAFDCCQVG